MARDEAPTVLDRPEPRTVELARGRVASGADLDATGDTSASVLPSHGSSVEATSVVTSPLDALQLDEIARSRSLAMVGLALTPMAALAILAIGGDRIASLVALISFGLFFIGNAALFFVSTPRRYTSRRVTAVWCSTTATLFGTVYYFGPFSAVLMGLGMGLYFVSLGHSSGLATMVYAVMALAHLVLSLLIVLGVTTDRGLVSSAALEPEYQLMLAVLCQGVLLAIFLLARSSRKTLLDSVQALHDATRALSQRELLLEEARQDFNRALRLGGIGRFTSATLGSYTLGEIVGRGAMGEVYRARHTGSGDSAAVKVLLLEAMSQAGALARFRREARVAASLDSPHVTRVLEVGGDEAEVPFIAMELLEGEDLAARLRRQPPLSHADTVDLVQQISRGLAAAADAGIVHRDIKPQNLFLTAGGVWKILDFGVSRLEGSGGTLTRGRVVGTPSYMAPEQARGGDVDHRCDLYALGAIAYRVLTGQPAFRHRDLGAMLYKVVHEMPARPTSVAPDLDADVDLFLAIALAKAPDDRFATGAALSAAMETALRGQLEAPLRAHGEALLAKLPWR